LTQDTFFKSTKNNIRLGVTIT